MLHDLIVQSSASLSIMLVSYLMLHALVDPNDPKQKEARKRRVNRKKMGGGGQIEMLAQLCGVSVAECRTNFIGFDCRGCVDEAEWQFSVDEEVRGAKLRLCVWTIGERKHTTLTFSSDT